MEVKNETTLKKKVKNVFKKPPYRRRQIIDYLSTVIELNIPQPNTCPECR